MPMMSTPAAAPASTTPGDAPSTPVTVPHTGAPENPTAEALRLAFGAVVQRVDVVWGETTVVIEAARAHDVIAWLRDVEGYDYLVDVTAVEYRTPARPLEVVWHLRALARRRFLRLKATLAPTAPLQVASITDLYSGANWLERECFDMFGITFDGHPDLRRLLLWEGYREGHPLRKDFPLRGRFSRAEQLKQALAADPEARYSMEELSIADAFHQLPADMRARLAQHDAPGHRLEGE